MKNESCGVENTVKIIGKKWTILIIRDLCEGKKRFGELAHSLEGISPRTLSLRLTQLEKEGIIKRKVFKEVPPHTEYSLTPRGESLRDIIMKMQHWGKTKY